MRELSPSDRVLIEAKCQRAVLKNLDEIGRQIGPRVRMKQIIVERGVVSGLRNMRVDETSGWNDLFLAGLLGKSVEATILESVEFRQLFKPDELQQMDDELRASGYIPRSPT